MKNTNRETGGQVNKPSIKSQLAAVGLPALLLAFGLSQPNAQPGDIIVAGGPDVVNAALAATQYCTPCAPGVIVAGGSDVSVAAFAATQYCTPCTPGVIVADQAA